MLPTHAARHYIPCPAKVFPPKNQTSASRKMAFHKTRALLYKSRPPPTRRSQPRIAQSAAARRQPQKSFAPFPTHHCRYEHVAQPHSSAVSTSLENLRCHNPAPPIQFSAHSLETKISSRKFAPSSTMNRHPAAYAASVQRAPPEAF